MTDFTKFEALGKRIGEGIQAGIDSTADAVEASATGLIMQAETGIVNEAQIASPSKTFEYLGSMAGEGLLVGWKDQLQVLESVVSGSMSDLHYEVRQGAIAIMETVKSLREYSAALARTSPDAFSASLLRAGTVSQDASNVMRDLAQSMQVRQQQQLTNAGVYQRGSMGGNYERVNNSAVQFGPVYVNNEIDGAQLIYQVKQIMDARKPY